MPAMSAVSSNTRRKESCFDVYSQCQERHEGVRSTYPLDLEAPDHGAREGVEGMRQPSDFYADNFGATVCRFGEGLRLGSFFPDGLGYSGQFRVEWDGFGWIVGEEVFS
jgi:hypothetical protein